MTTPNLSIYVMAWESYLKHYLSKRTVLVYITPCPISCCSLNTIYIHIFCRGQPDSIPNAKVVLVMRCLEEHQPCLDTVIERLLLSLMQVDIIQFACPAGPSKSSSCHQSGQCHPSSVQHCCCRCCCHPCCQCQCCCCQCCQYRCCCIQHCHSHRCC